LSYSCRQHAFRLEKFRHAVGDVPLNVLSWYRHRAYNDRIGGAKNSKHILAIATDFATETVDRVGRQRWFATAESVFSSGGVGDYPAGSAHLDSRGYRARWRSF